MWWPRNNSPHTPVGGGVPDALPRRTPNFPQLLTGSFAIASDAFPFPRKSAARDPAAAVMRPLKIDPLFPVGRDTPSAPVPPVPLATHGNPPRVSLPLGKGGYLSPYYSVPSPSDFLLRRFG